MQRRIAIFVHQPRCSIQSINGIIKALVPSYTIKIFTRHDLESDFFDDVDMVCCPGGIGDSDSFDHLMRIHAQRIRNYVASGGRYLGICMGAYWADTDYFGLLNDVRVVQYIKRPNSDTRRPHAKHISITWQDSPMRMYFYDGCTFVGNQNNFEVYAKYANGDPMAIIQDKIGLIGCHPEAEQHWYNDYSWMRKHWHGGQWGLLTKFVDNMFAN
jgi:glutamine amidotransferase-like uncharacterized protein